MATFGDVLKFASGLNGVSVRTHLTAIQAVPAIMSSADVQHIANAVAAHSIITGIDTKLAEAWGRLGLDINAPLTSGQTQISFGTVVMALAGNETSSTLTRQ